MDPPKDGFSAATAPPSGLGNYKGVMLCNRPPDDASKSHGLEGGHQPPFKSTISAQVGEQLGLPPPKRFEQKSEVKTRGPSAALRRHCQWIKELQEQVREDQRQADDGAHAQEQRKQRMQEVFRQQRDAIRRIKSERDPGSIDPCELEAIIRPKVAAPPKLPTEVRKPLWAMTEHERDGCEDEEAADLIRFAEDLDFDKYIDDLEFRQCLQVVRDRAKRLQREQDAFKDSLVREFNSHAEGDEGDGASVFGGSDLGSRFSEGGGRAGRRRPRGDGSDDRPEWDASTACGEDRQSVDRDAQSAAERVLEANPQLRAVHSKGSVQRLIEKAQSGPPSTSHSG